MRISFEELENSSRLWIYQASRVFTEQEEQMIAEELDSFCEQWAAHGQDLKTSFTIQYHQFIVLAADESYHNASGCSIDSSVHVIKSLETQTGISFFDRSQIAFQMDGQTVLFPISKLKEAFSGGTLTSDTLTFNNLVATKHEWQHNWLQPAKNTWLARYLSQPLVTS